MKNSIGSLAALATTLVAPAALHAAIQAADFSNVPLSLSDETPINFDIDGDGTTDFYIYGNGGWSVWLDFNSPTQSSSDFVTAGTVFAPVDATSSGFELIESGQSGYYGFSFVTGGETHTAWVYFDINDTAPVVVNGAWETTPGASITVGATPVPEPASVGFLAGAAALLGALGLRRRRRS